MTARLVLPRHETPAPKGVKGSYGPAVRAWARRKLGIVFGPWQTHAIDQALRHDRNGDIIARVVLISTARQNGKSIIVRCFIGWMLDEGRHLPPFRDWTEILGAAHDRPQARIVYKGVLGDFEGSPELKAKTRLTQYFGIQQERLTFDVVTSQPGSVRGHSAGAVLFDEVMTQRDFDMFTALGPVLSAQRSPILILTSTAGTAESAVLRKYYDDTVRMAAGDVKPNPAFYGVWWESADKHAGLDWTQIRQANPALGDGRLSKAVIAMEHATFPASDWARERLNHWQEDADASEIHPGLWAACRLHDPLAGHGGPFALGVDVAPGWTRATITVAGIRTDSRVGVNVYRDMRATLAEPITAERVIAAVHSFPDPVAVVSYDMVNPAAAAFRRDAEETGHPWDELTPSTMVAACMDVVEMIQSQRLAVDDPLIDAQVMLARKKAFGTEGMFRWTRGDSAGPIDAFLSMTFAAHAAAYREKPLQIFLG